MNKHCRLQAQDPSPIDAAFTFKLKENVKTYIFKVFALLLRAFELPQIYESQNCSAASVKNQKNSSNSGSIIWDCFAQFNILCRWDMFTVYKHHINIIIGQRGVDIQQHEQRGLAIFS